MIKVNVTYCHLHIQLSCKNGGGVYDRNASFNNNNTPTILCNSRCNYHKYCHNYNLSHNYEQIKFDGTFASAELCAAYPYLKW